MDVWLSFYEIYCGKLYDLLNDKNILFARYCDCDADKTTGTTLTSLDFPRPKSEVQTT